MLSKSLVKCFNLLGRKTDVGSSGFYRNPIERLIEQSGGGSYD